MMSLYSLPYYVNCSNRFLIFVPVESAISEHRISWSTANPSLPPFCKAHILPSELVVIVIVLDPEIPLPAGPVTVIVTVILALGNEWVIFGWRVSDAPREIVEGFALMLTESLRPTCAEVLRPVANSEPFALAITMVTMAIRTATVTDIRRGLRSGSFPVATVPRNLVTLGEYARILPMKDIALARDLQSLSNASS